MTYKIYNKKERHIRTEMTIGRCGLENLQQAKILVFGCGGVGGFVLEALGRAGVGTIHMVDPDVVSESNINRQIIADYSTIGRNKAELICERLKKINPDIVVNDFQIFYLPNTKEAEMFNFESYDYVIDAIDTTKAKLDIIKKCKAVGTPVISSMGTGNKLDNTKFKIEDISKTSVCPLARVIRKELSKSGIRDVKVLYSTEEPVTNKLKEEERNNMEPRTPGSISYVPATAGLLIAGEVIKDLLA